MNNTFDFKGNKIIKNTCSNFIIVVLKTMDKEIILANVYGPNKDDPLLVQILQENLQGPEDPNIVTAGDWNLVLDPVL